MKSFDLNWGFGAEAGGHSTNKPNGKRGTAKTVVFEKAVNGTYYVIEAVPDTAKKTNFIVSAYMSKNGAKKQPPRPSLAKKARALRPNTQGGWLLIILYHSRLRKSTSVMNKH